MVVGAYEPHAPRPIPDLGRPVRVRLVPGITGKPRRGLEHRAVRHGVLVLEEHIRVRRFAS